MAASSWLCNGTLENLGATYALGARLGRAASAGQCIALNGELGAGKTTLSRAVAEAFGMREPREFASPTYTYVHPYAGKHHDILHFDFYRVGDEESAYALGLIEMLARNDALLLIEWAEKLPELVPSGALWLQLQRTPGQDVRHFRAQGGPANLHRAFQPAAGPSS